MTDDLRDDGDGGPKTEENLPGWTATPLGGTSSDDQTLSAGQGIDIAKGEEPARQQKATVGAAPAAQPVADDSVRAAVSASVPVGRDRARRRRLSPIVLVGALVALAAAGLIGWAIGRVSTSSIETSESDVAAADEAGSDDSDAQITSTDDTDAETSTTADPATTTTSTTVATTQEPFVVPDTADNPSGATQYAVMAGGKAVMRGWYPTEEQAKEAVADAAVIMGGMENVTDETNVDPRAEIRPDSFAVYLQDFILFESNSAEITPEFFEFLGFPLFFMQNNPAATVTVVARTDARGSEEYNLELATRRAEAVRDFWLANGGNADQIILDPRGEEGAAVDADDEQAALDRRVELQVSGFLSG